MNINPGIRHPRDCRRTRQQKTAGDLPGQVHLAFGVALAGWILLTLLRRHRGHPDSLEPKTVSPIPNTADPDYSEKLSGGKDFRFLLAILVGVALGVGVAALQTIYELAAWNLEFLVLAILWVASFLAVALVYLAVKYGSVVFDVRIDATENILLMIVTVAECGMFISVGLGPGPNLALRWLISLSAFGLAASCMTTVVHRRLVRQLHHQTNSKLRDHINSLPGDIMMAFLTFLGPVVYVSINPHPSMLGSLIIGSVVALFLLTGIIKQRQMRRRVFS